jgi:hypothetical protein
MLLVKVVNIGGGEETAMYEAEVFVNTKRIWRGKVGPHIRGKGWTKLIRQLATKAEFNPCTDEESSNRCPACDSAVRMIHK